MTLNFLSPFEKEIIRGGTETKEALIGEETITVGFSLRYLCGYYGGEMLCRPLLSMREEACSDAISFQHALPGRTVSSLRYGQIGVVNTSDTLPYITKHLEKSRRQQRA